MGKECVEFKLKGITQSVKLFYLYYDKIFLRELGMKTPTQSEFDTIAGDKILDNLFIFCGSNYEGFMQAVKQVGYSPSEPNTFSQGGFSNKLLDRFLISIHNRQFTAFFNEFNQRYRVPLRGQPINCVVLQFPYIQKKLEFVNKSPQISQVSVAEVQNKVKAKCLEIREELYLIDYQSKKVDQEERSFKEQVNHAEDQYEIKMVKLKDQFQKEEQKSKELIRLMRETETMKKSLEEQKEQYATNLKGVLEKEVSRKLKDYQAVLKARHKEQMNHLEKVHNLDISQRRIINLELQKAEESCLTIRQQTETYSLLAGELKSRETVTNLEIQLLERDITELDKAIQQMREVEQIKMSTDLLACKFCGEKIAQMVFRPCGHLLYCEGCWIDYLTDERDPFLNQTKYLCLVCFEFRKVLKIEGFTDPNSVKLKQA